MKITGWTYFEDKRYTDINELDEKEYREATEAVIEGVRKSGIKFSGSYHQKGDDGCPIVDDKYLYAVSMRSWGRVMAEALNLPDEDGYTYVHWAWSTPKDDEPVYPGGE